MIHLSSPQEPDHTILYLFECLQSTIVYVPSASKYLSLGCTLHSEILVSAKRPSFTPRQLLLLRFEFLCLGCNINGKRETKEMERISRPSEQKDHSLETHKPSISAFLFACAVSRSARILASLCRSVLASSVLPWLWSFSIDMGRGEKVNK